MCIAALFTRARYGSNLNVHRWWIDKENMVPAYNGIFSSVQLLSHVRLFVTPWVAARQATLSITNSQRPPKPMSIVSVMPCSHLILCHPLLLPPILPSIRVFSNESTLCMRWPKYWSFSFNISPSNEYPAIKKELIWVSCSELDEYTASYAEYS